MKHRFPYLPTLLLGLWLLSVALVAQGQSLTPDDIAKDSRLSTPITLAAPRIYLYELLAAITKETGVKVSVDPLDAISGIPLSVSLNKVPLSDVMSGLWSALGYRGATLDWRLTAVDGVTTYRLASNRVYRALPDRLNRAMLEALEAQSNVTIDIAYMTPEQRQSEATRLSKVLLEENNQIAKIYLQDIPPANQFWAEVRLFAQMVPQERRQAVLRGETVSIPFEKLSKEWQSFIRESQDKISEEKPDGTLVALPSPTPTLLRYAMLQAGKNKKNCTTLMMEVETKNGVSRLGLFGMMDRGLIRRGYANWILSGDTKASPLAKQIVEKPTGRTAKASSPQLDIIHKLIDIASAAPISYLGVVPDEAQPLQNSPYGQSVQKFLEVFREYPYYLMSKWRNGLLLLNYPYWFYGDEAQFNYQSLQKLRMMADKREGYLSLAEIVQTLSQFTKPQLERLAEEFPVLQAVMNWDVFTVLKGQPDIFTDRGIPIDASSFATLQTSLHLGDILPDKRVVAIRLYEETRVIDTKDVKTLTFSIRTEEDKWIPIHGIHLLPRNANQEALPR
ncbi:MAG: hypothetical protein NT023_07240 [Armatimonadetes bacterium]|nr:hypothetical protein [Armatimonadota bacterium]